MALYRVFEDGIVGYGPMATKISAIAGVSNISYDNPIELDCPDEYVPSLRWECLDEAAEIAMQRIIDEKNNDPALFWKDRAGVIHQDAGNHQREMLFHRKRIGPKVSGIGDFKAKPKKPVVDKPAQVAPSEINEAAPKRSRKAKQAI